MSKHPTFHQLMIIAIFVVFATVPAVFMVGTFLAFMYETGGIK